MVRTHFIAAAVAVLLAFPAYAEQPEQAKNTNQQIVEMNRQLGELYSKIDDDAKLALALGLHMGMAAVISWPNAAMDYPPDYENIEGLLNYCYVHKNCEHVSPQFIAFMAYKKPSEAHKILRETERDIFNQ